MEAWRHWLIIRAVSAGERSARQPIQQILGGNVMRRMAFAATFSFTVAATFGLTGFAFAASCASLTGKTFGDATISAANAVSPPFTVMSLDPPAPVAINAPFCRVQGVLKPSPDSDIKFEVWLPPASA
jgi:hypothetical protein